MRIAVAFEKGQVFQHFGHTEQFMLYDVEDGKAVSHAALDANGEGHGALAELLKRNRVDTLICGGIGGGARQALADAGIRVYGGVTGEADQAVKALINNELVYDPNARCGHHDHAEGHSCRHGGDHL